jgi:hypothetical protein
MILTKIFGGLLFVGGLLMMIGFPYFDTRYTSEGMVNSTNIIGLILMGIGAYLAFTG